MGESEMALADQEDSLLCGWMWEEGVTVSLRHAESFVLYDFMGNIA